MGWEWYRRDLIVVIVDIRTFFSFKTLGRGPVNLVRDPVFRQNI